MLDLTRLDAGEVVLRRAAEDLEDLVGAALHEHDERLAGRAVDVRIPADLPAVDVDAGLVAQLFGNLFDNAEKYTPAGTRSACPLPPMARSFA